MSRKPPIPSSTVTFGGFESKGDKVVMKFYLMNDFRNVGELTYEIPSGPKEQWRRLARAHTQIERSLQELLHINSAMLTSVMAGQSGEDTSDEESS